MNQRSSAFSDRWHSRCATATASASQTVIFSWKMCCETPTTTWNSLTSAFLPASPMTRKCVYLAAYPAACPLKSCSKKRSVDPRLTYTPADFSCKPCWTVAKILKWIICKKEKILKRIYQTQILFFIDKVWYDQIYITI